MFFQEKSIKSYVFIWNSKFLQEKHQILKKNIKINLLLYLNSVFFIKFIFFLIYDHFHYFMPQKVFGAKKLGPFFRKSEKTRNLPWEFTSKNRLVDYLSKKWGRNRHSGVFFLNISVELMSGNSGSIFSIFVDFGRFLIVFWSISCHL